MRAMPVRLPNIYAQPDQLSLRSRSRSVSWSTQLGGWATPLSSLSAEERTRFLSNTHVSSISGYNIPTTWPLPTWGKRPPQQQRRWESNYYTKHVPTTAGSRCSKAVSAQVSVSSTTAFSYQPRQRIPGQLEPVQPSAYVSRWRVRRSHQALQARPCQQAKPVHQLSEFDHRVRRPSPFQVVSRKHSFSQRRNPLSQIRSLNSPHDQLKNLQGAINRKQKIVSDLTSQSSALQNQILSINNEVLNLQEIEKKLIGQISQAPISMLVNEDQYLQMQLRLGLMEQSMSQERSNMETFLSQLQAVPNLPEDAIKLMPITIGQAAPTSPLAASAPLSPPGPPASPGGSAKGMPTAYDSLDLEDDYGPLSSSPLRPSPYGPAPAPQAPSVFGEAGSAATQS
jgi:hypothetical protein